MLQKGADIPAIMEYAELLTVFIMELIPVGHGSAEHGMILFVEILLTVDLIMAIARI